MARDMTKTSEQNISEALKKALARDSLVYHGSPKSLEILRADATGEWSGEKGKGVFVTPYKGIAANFLVSRPDIVKRIERILQRNAGDVHFKYDQWNRPLDELTDIPKHIDIQTNVEGFEPFDGRSSGYLYSIDSGKHPGRHMFNKNPDSNVEFLLDGDISPDRKEKVFLRYTVHPKEETKTASDNTLDETIRRIKSHIVVNKGLDPDDVAQRILQLHMGRIFQHIFMVKAFASMIASKHPNASWLPKMKQNVLHHDEHKWNDIAFMGDYAPYIVEQYVGSRWFHTNGEYDKVHERVGRVHRMTSDHHVDKWCPFLKDSERKDKPLVPLLMPEYAMAEMCADWMAVSYELGETATNWFHKNQGKKWRFTKKQVAFIESILKDEPEFRKRFKNAN